MELDYLVKGAILGFSIAVPVGPIGILCIRKTLVYGRLSGFSTGLGAAIADTIYGVIAAFGLTFISNFLLAGQFWLRLIGGFLLLYLGIKTFIRKPSVKTSLVTHKTLLNDLVSTFFITLSNPMTILSYLAIFAGLGLTNIGGNYRNASWLVSGVFIGSMVWWVILSEGVTFFRKNVTPKVMTWINRLAGLLIIAFGMTAIVLAFI